MKAEDLLPDSINQADIDGVVVRKGTVGAFLANARIWSDDGSPAQAREIAASDILDALPALRALRIFEVLEIRDAALRALVDAN
jgi:hypothetical protein